MFGWNIAKSAEAMLSRSVIRRLCKFLLKKKLGEFICGDIDLDQLDVQLGKGTIQLKDLALNVDYLNQKLHAAPVVVKEGSIGSLLVKIPWKLANCQIEVDGLELVLAPCRGSNVPEERDNVASCQDGKQSVINGLEKVESATACGSSGSLSLEVHEGVKTIAKMVKWLLTSFHVKIKKLIVAFEPWLENDRERDKSHRTLVLCISEAEYGTCVSEDTSSLPVSVADSFLGMSRLTNFIKFQGAVIELLQMDIVDNQLSVPTASGATFTDNHAESKSSGTRTPVLTGEVGGFSGNLKLSIPWKNGSLDINKVDADVHIDPLKFKLQPSTINWIICSWECLKDVGVDRRSDMQHKTAESVCRNFSSCYQSFTQGSALTATSRVIPSSEKLSHGSCSLSSHALETDYLLQGAHVIADWVPLSNNRCQKDGVEPEPDYGASIDQFFECFDGMRSSHAAALGHSGIWNWTCSVFSAITAASSLAAGSVHISPEQHHVETILRATVAGISVILSFHDENQGQSHDSQGGDGNIDCLDGTENESCLTSDVVISSTGSSVPVYSCLSSEQSTEVNSASVHYLEAMCRELVLSLQVCRKSIKVEAIIKHIEVDDCFTNGNIAGDFGFSGCEQSVHNQMILFQRLQADVQGALPPFSFSVQDANAEEMIFNPFHHEYMNANLWEANQRASCHGDLVKVKLLKSVGMQDCQLVVSSTYIDNKSGATTSFSLDLPPFILWVDFSLVNLLFDLSKKVGTSLDMNNAKKDSVSVGLGGRHDSSHHGDLKSGTCTYIKDVTPRGSVRGNIFLPRTRIILCFPFEDHGDSRHCSSWDEFVCLDFSPSLSPKNVRDASPLPNVSFQKGYSDSPSNSISLNFGDLNIYLISSARGCDGGTISSHQTFSAEKIFSATRGADGCHSVISMSWQGGPVTGSWIARKAWGVVTSQESRNRKKVTGKGYEFASVTTAEHLVETDSCVQQEMILSSAFVLHVHFSLVWINLGRSEYELLQSLLSRLSDGFKKEHGSVSDGNSSQVSVLIDCDVVKLSIKIEKGTDVNCSLQKELSGSWDSLRLVIEKFELLSVSNIGGINSANFFWVSHDEGELWGYFDEVSDDASAAFKEYLLISCRNSTIRRGDGEGTNALSSGSAGSVIMHLLDPQSFQSFTSITVRCGTIVAPGGRMDWVNEICNFFSLPSSENEQASTSSMQNGLPADHASFVASFCLDLVDIALSYEPYMKNPISNDGDWESEGRTSDKPVEESGEQPVPCLLAASSLNLSTQTVSSLPSNDYKIRLHDLGLLLCSSSGSENDRGIYSVDYLRRNGYVKVASEALVEAVLRTNCNNGLLWELECSESHVNIDTCCDTTAGLIHLAAQLQQLFAPDMNESIVHLQNRWNNIQQTHGHGSADATTTSTCESSSFASINGQTCHRDVDHRLVGVGLMDGILEDAFYMNRNRNSPSNSGESQSHIALDVGLHGDVYSLDINTPTASDVFPGNVSLSSSMPGLGFENIQIPSSLQKSFYPDVVEGFYVPELCPPQASSNDYSPREVDLKLKSKKVDHLDMECGNSRWYDEDNSLRIIEDHVSKVSHHPAERQIFEGGKFPSVNSMTHDGSCEPCGRVILKNIDVKWRMYAGLDWPNLRKNVPHTMSTCGRDSTVCLELTLSRMKMQYDMFPDREIYVSRLSLSVQDFHLYDNSKDAPWKKVLGYYQSKKHPRESSTNAFKLDLEAVRPDPFTPLEEYRLRLAFHPIQLHLDQRQLDFLIGFFTRKESSNEQSPDVSNDLGGSRVSLEKSRSFAGQTIAQEALLPFFQKIDIWPAIVRVDYNPRHFDLTALRGGNYGELLNLVPLKGIELELKHVHAVGVYGWSNVGETVIGEWLEDISRNQVHKLLKGLHPIRSFVAVGSGAAKLVSLPVENYRKDHRLLKGVQRGAIAFVRSVSLEAVGLGLHLAAGAHDILLQTECILANVPPSVPGSVRSRATANVRTNQPKDVQQGIQQAYESISDGLGRTASSLVGNPIKTYQRGAGLGSALASAARAAPAAAIAPASATARALHCALLGVRNSLDPEHKKESMEKYLGTTHAQDHRK